MNFSDGFDPVEFGCLDAPDLFPAGNAVRYEFPDYCLDENGYDTGYFRIVGYGVDYPLVRRYPTW